MKFKFWGLGHQILYNLVPTYFNCLLSYSSHIHILCFSHTTHVLCFLAFIHTFSTTVSPDVFTLLFRTNYLHLLKLKSSTTYLLSKAFLDALWFNATLLSEYLMYAFISQIFYLQDLLHQWIPILIGLLDISTYISN